MMPRLLILTDRTQLPSRHSLLRTVGECVEAGATHVVLRELDLPDDQRAELATAMHALGATVIAAHRPLPGVAGVHLPSSPGDRGIEELAGPGLRGRSCHTRAEVEAAAVAGFDYVTLGPYAATASKPGYGPALAATEYAGLPLATYALGGVASDNAGGALAAGAYGVAVMGGVMRAEAPGAVVRGLLGALG